MASANPVFLADRFLETLMRTLAMKKIGSYIGVPYELEKLWYIILETRPVLDYVARARRGDEGWLKCVQDVLHEADDVVAELRTEILLSDLVLKRRRDPVITKALAFNNLVFRQKLERIREKTDMIMEERRYFLSPTRQSELKHGLSSAVGSEIIGREKDLVAIIEDLVSFYPVPVVQNVSITCVVASAGTGKTVLAQLAFNHEWVVNHFGSMRIWVNVSGAFDAKHIADSIVRSLTSKRAQKDMLEKEIAGRKYLLVMCPRPIM